MFSFKNVTCCFVINACVEKTKLNYVSVHVAFPTSSFRFRVRGFDAALPRPARSIHCETFALALTRYVIIAIIVDCPKAGPHVDPGPPRPTPSTTDALHDRRPPRRTPSTTNALHDRRPPRRTPSTTNALHDRHPPRPTPGTFFGHGCAEVSSYWQSSEKRSGHITHTSSGSVVTALI